MKNFFLIENLLKYYIKELKKKSFYEKNHKLCYKILILLNI